MKRNLQYSIKLRGVNLILHPKIFDLNYLSRINSSIRSDKIKKTVTALMGRIKYCNLKPFINVIMNLEGNNMYTIVMYTGQAMEQF
jgi:hypothetical protein